MQWAPHTLNEGPHQAWAVCLVLFNVLWKHVRNHLATTQFLISHFLNMLSVSFTTLIWLSACEEPSQKLGPPEHSLQDLLIFYLSLFGQKTLLTTFWHVFTFLISLLYKYLTSYSTRLSSLHVQARLGCDAETPSETVRFQDTLMKNHSAMWLQSSSDKSMQKCNLFGSSWIFLSQCCVFLFFVQDLRNLHQNFNFWGRARRKRSKHSSRRRRRSGTVKRDEGLQQFI